MKAKDIVIVTIITGILLIFGSTLGIFLSLNISKSIYMTFSPWIIISVAAIHIIHELIHYLYLYFKVHDRTSVLRYKFNPKGLVIWLYTDKKISMKEAITYLLLPTFFTVSYSIIVILNSLNLLYAILLGYSLALSSLDLFLLVGLKKMDCTHVSMYSNTQSFKQE